jgi:8-oxo-dGTP diphosphatase
VGKQKAQKKQAKKQKQAAAQQATALRLEDWPRPSVAVDVVVLTVKEGALFVALYERKGEGRYALPGGFVRIDEALDDAARRLVADKAGFDDVFMEQLYTFGDPARDERGRVITVAYVALLSAERFFTTSCLKGRVLVPWPGETGGPVDVDVVSDDDAAVADLAFDHRDILGLAVKRLRGKLDYTPIGFQLLPAEFTLRQLQDIHEAVRAESVNKDSFRRRMLASGHLEATGNHERDVTWRPAELYRFVRRSAV